MARVETVILGGAIEAGKTLTCKTNHHKVEQQDED